MSSTQHQPTPRDDMRIAVAGLGAIGQILVHELARGRVPGMKLTAVAARNQAKARATLERLTADVPIYDLDQLPAMADIIVECAPAAVLDRVVRPVLLAGKTVIVGYLARASDPAPGNIVMWRGLSRLSDIELGALSGEKFVDN